MLQETQSGAQAPSYEYQATCPNDQNLIHVAGPRRDGRDASRAAAGSPRHPGAGARAVHPLQPADRGLGREAGGRDPRRGQGLREPEGPGGAPRRRYAGRGMPHGGGEGQPLLGEARRPAHRPLGRLRRPQLPHARSARARLLHRGDRRHPARPREVLLERRLRPPQLHHRPQRDPELRRVRLRRRGGLPRRVAADRRVPRRELLPRAALQHGRSAAATCTDPPWATPARWATPCG